MKIFKLFACLSKEELKLLRKAVISPIYNTNQKVVRLFEILRPSYPNFDDSVKVREKIFKKLFPKEAYNDYKLRWHFTELTKIIEQLLLYIGQEADEFERQKRLAEMYRQRNLYPQFTKENTSLLNQLKATQTNFSGADLHLNKLQLLEVAYEHPSYNKYDISDTMLEQALDSLDAYYILKKLKLTISLKSKERIQGKKYQHRFLDTIYQEIDQKFKEENQLLNLYQQAIKLIEEEETFEFDKYEQNLFSHLSFLDEKNQKLFFFNGLNYLIRRYNLERTTKLFEWNQKGLNLNLFIDSGMMTESVFGNIAVVGANAKSFQWTEKFMLDYHIYLKEDIRKEVYAYYKGIWYFYQNRLDEALNLLNQNKSLSEYTHRTKFFIIRILFEKFLTDTTYLDVLSSTIQAFKAFIKRDKYFKEDKFIPHLNLIKIMQKIIKKRIRNESAIHIKSWLANELETSEPIVTKKWLVQKVEAL